MSVVSFVGGYYVTFGGTRRRKQCHESVLSDAMRSSRGYTVRNVNGYQEALDVESKIKSKSVAIIVSHYIRGGELTSVLEPEERRRVRGVLGREEDGGGCGLEGLEDKDERGSTETRSTRGASDAEIDEATTNVNKLRNRH